MLAAQQVLNPKRQHPKNIAGLHSETGSWGYSETVVQSSMAAPISFLTTPKEIVSLVVRCKTPQLEVSRFGFQSQDLVERKQTGQETGSSSCTSSSPEPLPLYPDVRGWTRRRGLSETRRYDKAKPLNS